MFEGVQEEVEVNLCISFVRLGQELYINYDAPYQGVGYVLMQEEKVKVYARKHEMEHLKYDLE